MSEETSEQNVFIFERKLAKITGVKDVDSFDSTELIASLASSKLAIDGEELKISGFDSEKQCLSLIGKINGVCYFRERAPKKNIFAKG